MYTVCYVLTDDARLAYYDELLISLSSLRGQRDDGPVLILTDEATAAELERQGRRDHRALMAQERVVATPREYSQKERSRFIKTSMREHVEGDLFFLDTDTVFPSPWTWRSRQTSPSPLTTTSPWRNGQHTPCEGSPTSSRDAAIPWTSRGPITTADAFGHGIRSRPTPSSTNGTKRGSVADKGASSRTSHP